MHRRSTRARLLRRAIVSLVFGVSVSIVFAWLIAFLGPDVNDSSNVVAWPLDQPHTWLMRQRMYGPGWRQTMWWVEYDESLLMGNPPYARLADTKTRPTDVQFMQDSKVLESRSFGVPFPCLKRLRWSRSVWGMSNTVAESGTWHVSWPERWIAPFLPVGLGLAADTIIFAVLWFIIGTAVRSIREGQRIARGLCTQCAYSLAGIAPGAPCPECGALVAIQTGPASVDQTR